MKRTPLKRKTKLRKIPYLDYAPNPSVIKLTVKKPLRKHRKDSVTKAKLRAWKVFSLYIRTKNSVNGENECYTCGSIFPIKSLQTGHWIEGHGNVVYINEDYVRPQCYVCNVIKHGNQGIFRDKIRAELGSDIVDQLIIDAHQTKDLTLDDYLELEKFYTHQLQMIGSLEI